MEGQGLQGDSGVGSEGGRIDWRTGKRMVARDDACWGRHEALRREQGLSIPQYCAANGLALSTFRHRVGRLAHADGGGSAAGTRPQPTGARGQFIALPHEADQRSRGMEIEVQLPGALTLRLQGTAAQ